MEEEVEKKQKENLYSGLFLIVIGSTMALGGAGLFEWNTGRMPKLILVIIGLMFGLCGPMVILLEKNKRSSAIFGFLVSCLFCFLCFWLSFNTDKLGDGRPLSSLSQNFIQFCTFIAGVGMLLSLFSGMKKFRAMDE